MLVLSRRKNEELTIILENKKINMRMIDIKSNQAKMGFTADKDVLILRNEIIGKDKKGGGNNG